MHRQASEVRLIEIWDEDPTRGFCSLCGTETEVYESIDLESGIVLHICGECYSQNDIKE